MEHPPLFLIHLYVIKLLVYIQLSHALFTFFLFIYLFIYNFSLALEPIGGEPHLLLTVIGSLLAPGVWLIEANVVLCPSLPPSYNRCSDRRSLV